MDLGNIYALRSNLFFFKFCIFNYIYFAQLNVRIQLTQWRHSNDSSIYTLFSSRCNRFVADRQRKTAKPKTITSIFPFRLFCHPKISLHYFIRNRIMETFLPRARPYVSLRKIFYYCCYYRRYVVLRWMGTLNVSVLWGAHSRWA